ncbi:MAG: hypothetical protein ACE366_22590 [Bradymonadia bacterium]
MMFFEYGSMMAFSWLFYCLLPILPLVYLVLRWRQGKPGEPEDTQLGLKVVLYYFGALGLHICLIAVAVALFGLMERHTEEFLRVSAGLLIGGGGIVGVMLYMASNTNTREFPRARRAMSGFSMILCGLALAVGWVMTAMALVIERSPDEMIKVGLVLVLVYGAGFSGFSRALR